MIARALAPALVLLLAPASIALAATPPGGGESVPDFTAGTKSALDKAQDLTLGPTGARGWIHARNLETSAARQVSITQVDAHSPADGILAVGDVILGVNEMPFASDARIALAKAITVAESEPGGGRLRLLRWRDGKQTNVDLKLQVMGSYSATAPYDCPKSSRIFEQGCRALAERMRRQDARERDDPVVRVLNALALLASGRSEYLPLVRQEARWAADFSIPAGGGYQTWAYGYVNLLLAEYVLATGDRSVEPGLERITLMLARGQSAVGTWGHYFAYPSGSLEGYGAINQAGMGCAISLVLARMAGVHNPDLDLAITRSERFLGFYIGKGAIPYGDHPPWLQTHDDNGKCGAGAVMFDLLDRARGAEFFSLMSTASHGAERDTGHTGNFFNILWALPGVSRSGPQATGAWTREFGWYFDLARRWDGTFLYQGEPGEKEDYSYGGWDSTGAYLLGYALPLKQLYLTGKKPSAAPLLDAPAANNLIDDGRDWSPGSKAAGYARRDAEQLFAGLSSWSPVVRDRSAHELARREGEPVPRLLPLLENTRIETRYGACQALAALGKRADAAVPALRGLLAADDLWLRIQAADALARIGEAARPAVPDLLRLAAQEIPAADPRGMVQRYLAFALFAKDGAPDTRGLLAGSLEGVDREQLDAAVEAVLQNEDGWARGTVGSVYQTLGFEEIKPLLPAIRRAIVEPAPSGEMFADSIRLAGLELLAKHRIAEGMALSLQIIEVKRWGAYERIPRCLKILETYGAAARPLLPELRKLEQPLKQRENGDQYLAQLRRTIDIIDTAKDAGPLRSLKELEQENAPVKRHEP